MARAETTSNQPYTPYEGPRIAGFNKDQLNSFGQVRDLDRFGGQFQDVLKDAGQFRAYKTPDVIKAGEFNNQQAGKYMDPYIQQVLDAQMARANQRFGEQNLALKGQAAKSGAFGGYRQGVTESLLARDFNDQSNEMVYKGLSDAYRNAQGQFNTDRDARIDAQKFNRTFGLDAFKTNEGLRQQLLGLRGNLTGQAQDSALERINALRQVGLQQQQQNQASLDLAYGDFQNQQNWDMNQLNFLSSIMHGVPITNSTTVNAYDNPNPYSQLLGLGLNGLAISNALGGQGGGGAG